MFTVLSVMAWIMGVVASLLLRKLAGIDVILLRLALKNLYWVI